MAKVTDEAINTIKGFFETGDTPTQIQFYDLIEAIQEAAQEHEHKSTGGAGTGTGDAGAVENLQSGLEANKPETPAVGDIYVATDTGNVFFCYVAGFWSTKAARFINRQMRPDDYAVDPHAATHAEGAGDDLAGQNLAMKKATINQTAAADILDALDNEVSTFKILDGGGVRLVAQAGISDEAEGNVWCDNSKSGFHQLRWRNATHPTRLDPGAQHLNRQFLIAYS